MKTPIDRAAGGPYKADTVARGGYYGIEGPQGREHGDWGMLSIAEDVAFGLNQAHLYSQRTAEARVQELEGMVSALRDAGDYLWVVLANVSGGDWTQQKEDWQEAVVKARDGFFKVMRDGAPNADQYRDRIAREARRDGMEAMRERAASLLIESSCDKQDKYAAAIRAIPIEGEEQET